MFQKIKKSLFLFVLILGFSTVYLQLQSVKNTNKPNVATVEIGANEEVVKANNSTLKIEEKVKDADNGEAQSKGSKKDSMDIKSKIQESRLKVQKDLAKLGDPTKGHKLLKFNKKQIIKKSTGGVPKVVITFKLMASGKNESGKYCVINDEYLTIGDSIDGYQLIEVSDNDVTLKGRDGEEVKIEF